MTYFNKIISILIYVSIFSKILAIGNKKRTRQYFGKYEIVMQDMIKCNASGPIHEGIFNNFNVTKVENGKKKHNFHINGYSSENYQVTSAYYKTEIFKDGEYKQIMEKNITNPCANEMFKITMTNLHKGRIDERCIVSKGSFESDEININALVHKILGNNFFHTKMRGLVRYYSPKGITLCALSIIEINPVVNTKKTA